jgi:tetratricopeptide (TPR) repeat protein
LAKYYYNCALESYNQKNYWATVEYCNKTLAHNRKDPNAYRLMGKAFSTHPKFRLEAMDAFKKSLELDPKNPLTLSDIGDLYYASGSQILAKARYQDVLALDPDNSHATSRLSELKNIKIKSQ